MYYVGYCQSYANFSWASSRLALYSNFLCADTCSSKLLCCSCLLNDICIPEQNNLDECIAMWFPSNYASRSTIGSHIFLFRQFELISIFFLFGLRCSRLVGSIARDLLRKCYYLAWGISIEVTSMCFSVIITLPCQETGELPSRMNAKTCNSCSFHSGLLCYYRCQKRKNIVLDY